jgi:hypothetical protein
MRLIINMPVVNASGVVNSGTAVVVLVVSVQRRETAVLAEVAVTGVVMAVAINRSIVISEVVMPPVRTNEQMQKKRPVSNPERRAVSVSCLPVNRTHKMYRGEQTAAPGQWVIPIAGQIHAASRRPDIASCDPRPIRLVRMPESGPPTVVVGRQHPVARDPKIVLGRRGAGWTDLQRFWRGILHVLQTRRVCRSPETRHPLIASRDLLPVSGDPSLIGWDAAPNTADPDVLVTLVIPEPIARNPDDIVSLRLHIRWDLVNRLGGLVRYHDTRFRLDIDFFSKCLVDRPASQYIDIRIIGAGRLRFGGRNWQLQLLRPSCRC